MIVSNEVFICVSLPHQLLIIDLHHICILYHLRVVHICRMSRFGKYKLPKEAALTNRRTLKAFTQQHSCYRTSYQVLVIVVCADVVRYIVERSILMVQERHFQHLVNKKVSYFYYYCEQTFVLL